MTYLSTASEEETVRLGRLLGTCLRAGDIISLDGDLGTGKTAIAKGIASGLGVNEPITSPTFTLVNSYQGRLPLHHFDIYRIDDPEELFAIGFEEYMDGEAVTLIEWAEKLDSLPWGTMIEIRLLRGQEVDERRINISGAPESFLTKVRGDTA